MMNTNVSNTPGKILHKDLKNRTKCVDEFTKDQPSMTTDNSHNSDTFNFLHDLYDGANMGQDSFGFYKHL
jgi:hypothetical protein